MKIRDVLRGLNEKEEPKEQIEFPQNYRDRHIFITGRSRAGKSTLIENMAVMDIYNGRSVIFIDPDGDSAKSLLSRVPKSRIDDIIYLEPEEYPLALNFLYLSDPKKKGVVIAEIVTIFKKLFSESGNWGDRMDAILRNTVAALLEVKGSTLWDIYRMLDDEDFRARTVAALPEEDQHYWHRDFENYPPNAPEPLLSRMQKIRHHETLRSMLDTPNAPTLSQLLSKKKGKPVLIVNLVKATEEFQGLLGSLIVNQLRDMVVSRVDLPKDRRPYTYLYIDEFQRFYIPGFESLCQQAGKFHLCMTLASHFPSQIKEDLRRNIMGIFGSFISFRLGADEAHLIAKTMGVKDDDLIHLVSTENTRGAYLKTPSDLQFFKSHPPIETDYDHSKAILDANKREMGQPRVEPPPPPAPEPRKKSIAPDW